MTDTLDHFGHIAAAAGKTQTSFFTRNPDGSYGPRAFGVLDPDIPYPWGGTAAEQAAAADARWGKGAGAMVGTGNGEVWVDVTPALRANGVTTAATNTDEEDARMIVGAVEFVETFEGAAPASAPTVTPTTSSPPSPIAAHPAVQVAHPDARAAANAAWLLDWPIMRPALIAAGHGAVAVSPSVRQAILAPVYPRYVALAQAGLIGADGKLKA
jgi:hypothetical protein